LGSRPEGCCGGVGRLFLLGPRTWTANPGIVRARRWSGSRIKEISCEFRMGNQVLLEANRRLDACLGLRLCRSMPGVERDLEDRRHHSLGSRRGWATMFVAWFTVPGSWLGFVRRKWFSLLGTRSRSSSGWGGTLRYFGPGIAAGLKPRRDHRPQYRGDAFQEEAAFLGIESSPAFLRSPGG
jgi:hypothetical protein